MRRVLAISLALGILAAAGCATGKVREDRAAFNAGYAAFQAGQWQRATDQFTRYLRSDPLTPTRGEVYYYRGQAQVHLKRRADAQADFERAVGAKAPPPIDSYARVAIGNLYYEEGNDAKAVEWYAEVLRNPPQDLPLDVVLLRTAVSLQRLGRWASADKYLAYLIDHHPVTSSAVEARRRLHATSFAVQTGAFASSATAASEAERLRAAGFVARIGRATRGGRTLYTVQVGTCRTYAEAQALAQRVSQAGFMTLIVP